MTTSPFPDEAAYQQYLCALLAGDRRACRKAFESWLDTGVSLRALYQDLVRRSLYDVGFLWERGQVSVATEHLATAITDSLLTLAYPRLFSQPHNGRSAVVTCVANEYHQIGGKMVADLFDLNGWRGYFLGANMPMQDLLDLIRAKRPDAVAMSLTVYFSLDALVESVHAVRQEFPTTPILVGGQAFLWGGRERVEGIAGVHYLGSLTELETWMKSPENYAAK